MQNKLQKILLILSIIFFAFLLLAFFFVYKEINANNTKTEQSMTEVDNTIIKRENVKLLIRSLEEIKEDKSLLETHFAKSSDIVPFLDTIEALAPRAGVKAETTSVDIFEGNSGLMVTMKATGSFESIYKFLMFLENSPYELEFTAVDMERENSGEALTAEGTVQKSGWRATFEIKLVSFIQ